MKLRLEVILAILQWLSDQPEPVAQIPSKLCACPDVPEPILRYHVRLCEEAGFIEQHKGNKRWHRLTWGGHRHLQASH